MKKIALTFSGGGFRAAAYCLGCLKYLNSISYNNELLINNVKFISSTSGGSMANIWYTLAMANGQTFNQFYDELISVLSKEDVLAKTIDELANPKLGKLRPEKSENLINALSIIYDQYLNGKTLGDINTTKNIIPKICINSTELANGLAFRFNSQNPQHNFNGKVGNFYINLTQENIYNKLKLADIMAASSCFPSGFEPLIFPNDFTHKDLDGDTLRNGLNYRDNPFTLADKTNQEAANYNKIESVTEASQTKLVFGLMDGGIVDNQAIDGFIKEAERGNGDNEYDLIISCDVSSYFMDAYTLPQPSNTKKTWWSQLKENIIFWVAKNFIRKKFTNPSGTWAITFAKYIDKFLSLRNDKLILMLQTRIKSVFMLANDLYLKQIRRMYQAFMFSHPKYKDKFILNAIYDLSSANPKLPTDPLLKPSANMMAKAEQARIMSTTIWFDAEHQKQNSLQTIIDTGEFTMCFNLLKYFKNRKDKLESKEISIIENELLERLEKDYLNFKAK